MYPAEKPETWASDNFPSNGERSKMSLWGLRIGMFLLQKRNTDNCSIFLSEVNRNQLVKGLEDVDALWERSLYIWGGPSVMRTSRVNGAGMESHLNPGLCVELPRRVKNTHSHSHVSQLLTWVSSASRLKGLKALLCWQSQVLYHLSATSI